MPYLKQQPDAPDDEVVNLAKSRLGHLPRQRQDRGLVQDPGPSSEYANLFQGERVIGDTILNQLGIIRRKGLA